MDRILRSAPAADRPWLSGRLNWSNEIGLRRRLRFLVNRHPTALADFLDVNSFLKLASDTRNYLTHYDERLTRKAARAEKLEKLTNEMATLVELCLLEAIGLPEPIRAELMGLRMEIRKW